MYRVLLPVDTDESRALAQVSYVTSLPAAETVEATLLFVFDETGDGVPNEHKRFNTATRVGSVRRARERLENAGVEVHVYEDSGDPAERILAAAEADEYDAIVVGGRKRSPVGKAVFGSVAQEVLRGTGLPVVVTGAGEEA